jgi:hypothetical protein
MLLRTAEDNRRREADASRLGIQLLYARKRDFKESFAICNVIISRFWLIRTLMEIGCESEEEAALKTIDLAWKNARDQENGFPEADLLGSLDTISSNGHGKLVRSILEFALARIEMMDDGEFRLNCFDTMMPYLAVHWREKAEQVIDSILSLPTDIPDGSDSNLHPEPAILFDMALNISTYELTWTQERQEHFQRHLEHLQSVDVIEQERSKVRFATVFYSRSECEHQSRYIHKYYLPQELRTGIFPVDIQKIICLTLRMR